MRTPTSTRTDVPRAAAAGPAPAAARAHDAAAPRAPVPPPSPAAGTDTAAPAPPAPATTASSPARTVAERAGGGRSADRAPAPARVVAERTAGRESAARIVAERAGSATVLRELRAAAPWAPRPLPGDRGGAANVALVQTAATLVSGDDCAIELELRPGAALTVVETGATIAHHVRGGAPARLLVRIRLGAGARLTWLARPLVLGAGCAVERTTTIELAEGAQALLRETVVLGRSGEAPGALRSTLRATHTGRPLLHEQLDSAGPAPAASPAPAVGPAPATSPAPAAGPAPATGPASDALLRSRIVAGDATVLDTVMLLGARGADLPGATQLAGPGTLWRALGARGADPDGPARAVAETWAPAQ